jgi:hypothetical protein
MKRLKTLIVNVCATISIGVAPLTSHALTTIGVEPLTSNSLTTIGIVDCGSWLKQRSENQSGYSEVWVNGFLTAGSIFRSKELQKDLLKNIKSNDQVFIWIDNYCQKDPLSDTALAALELLYELSKK